MNVKFIFEIRKVYVVRLGKDLIFEKCVLSCFCECCVEGVEMVEGCFNKFYVGSWEKGIFIIKRKEKSMC